MQNKEFESDRKKARGKAERLFSSPHSLLPDSTVIEQASSFPTAQYAASLVNDCNLLVDLTAGLGVNTFCFSEVCRQVLAIEIDPNRARILKHNLEVAGAGNVEVICNDCVDWLKGSDLHFNAVYVDPSRRSDCQSSRRLLLIEDCSPNLFEVIPLLEGRCEQFMVKISPLFDLKQLFKLFPQITSIHIVEVKNEVKELLVLMNLSEPSEIDTGKKIICVRLGTENNPEILEFEHNIARTGYETEFVGSAKTIEGHGYIYEPSPALMKSGMSGRLASAFEGMRQFDPNSFFFYSDIFHSSYPGRIFKLKKRLSSSDLKKMKGEAFNVVSRNHPAKSKELEQRYRFRTSEVNFLIASIIGGEKVMFNAERIK